MALHLLKRRTILPILIGLGLGVLFGAAAHEAGHAITAKLFSRQIYSIGIAPGLELYPRLRVIPWDGWIAYVDHDKAQVAWQAGLCTLMGCGTTALLSYGILAAAFFARHRRTVLMSALLSASIVFANDIVMYAILPQLGLRHGIFIGGSEPEPLRGAQMMGVSVLLFWVLLGLHFFVFHALVYRCCEGRRDRTPNGKRNRSLRID